MIIWLNIYHLNVTFLFPKIRTILDHNQRIMKGIKTWRNVFMFLIFIRRISETLLGFEFEITFS